MKKILIIHNKYQHTGGEDIAVENEIKLLEKHFEVRVLFFDNNVGSYLTQFIFFIMNKNIQSSIVVKNNIKDFEPDIIYIHNTWFKASTSIFKVIKKSKIQTIVKLHNFRFFCSKTFFSKKHLDGSDYCLACGFKRDGKVLNRYFENNIIKSILLILYGRKYYKIIKNQENLTLLVLTNFQKSFLKSHGFSDNVVKYPNFIEMQEKYILNSKLNHIVYAGRISPEKGVEDLIKAFNKSKLDNFILKIIGNGPQKEYLEKNYASENVEFLGEISNKETKIIISKSKAVATASRLYEGQPTLLCEASLLKIPSIFPDTGGVKEFFPLGTQLIFNQFDYNDLEKKFNLLNDSKLISDEGLRNYEFINNKLDEVNLIGLFKEIISK
jgi:glycosyltransferase involved in cell wall biosynthesis